MNVIPNRRAISRILFFVVIAIALVGCIAPRPNITIPLTPPPVMPLKDRPQVILVLGGGGARGYAHIGVIKALQDAGVPIDMIVGSSAGSLMGAMYADSGDANQLEKTMLHTTLGDFIDVALVPDLKGPVVGNQFQNFLLKNMHAKDFNQLKIRLVVVTTDLDTGKPYPIESGPIAPAVLASAAIPGVVKPYNLYGRTLVDGGVIDPVPVDIAKSYRPKIIIAVDLVSNLPAQMPITAYGIFYRAYSISWDKLDELSAEDADIIIHPNVGSTSMFDIAQKHLMFEQGEAAAYQALPKIKQLLALHHIQLKSKRAVKPEQ